MKKTVSIFASIIIILTLLCSINASAEEAVLVTDQEPIFSSAILNEYKFNLAGFGENLTLQEAEDFYFESMPDPLTLDEEKENIIIQDFIQLLGDWVSPDEISLEYYGTLSDGSMLVFPDIGFYFTAIDYIVIRDYLYITSCIGNDVLIYKNNSFRSIADAYALGELTDELLDEVAVKLHFIEIVDFKSGNFPLLGDADGDFKVNIKDATFIQKLAASLIEASDVPDFYADVNFDSKINVNDATAIQKFAAGIYTGFPIGTAQLSTI